MLERRARAAREHAVVVPATSLVLFRETTIAGTFAGLGGVERLRDWVTLRSGRLPARCTPERCEVLRFRGEGRLPQPAGLRIVEVGEAVLVNRVLFGDFLAPTDNALADAEVSPSVARAAGYRPASCSSASAWGTPRRHPRELSGGEQQRVALCAAVARRTQLLIADGLTGSPTSATAASATSGSPGAGTARSSSAAAADFGSRRSSSARPGSTAARRRGCATRRSSSRRRPRDFVLLQHKLPSLPLSQAVRRRLVLFQHKRSRRAD